MSENTNQISTEAQAPLDHVLLNYPEVRLGTIVDRVGWAAKDDRGGIIWTFRMPDGSYCVVSIGSDEQPSKKPLDPKIAELLEEAWQDMGEVALGDKNGGFNYASDGFLDFAEEAIHHDGNVVRRRPPVAK